MCVVTNDTEEIITEKIPLYFRHSRRRIRSRRNEIESLNLPISVGGVLVKPDDVVVADGDDVLVVPLDQAQAVASYTRKILEGDKAGRRKFDKQFGSPEDASVK